jgi:polyvinyl alcohol dehydrogenase (cytochrome)
VMALHIGSGTIAWLFHPLGHSPACDDDFGASANVGVTASGKTSFLGAGSKDGTYYSLNPATGRQRWATNVVFGGSSGGFIGGTAYDGRQVYGATGIGDFLPTKNDAGPTVCDPSDPADTATQNPTDHAFDAATGSVSWQDSGDASFSPTTVAGGMVFNGPALAADAVQVRDATTGHLIVQVGLPQSNWSGIATVGNALVLGLGSTYDAKSSGIEVLTPDGTQPVVPRSR